MNCPLVSVRKYSTGSDIFKIISTVNHNINISFVFKMRFLELKY